MIQITPQMLILVAIEAVDGRKGIDYWRVYVRRNSGVRPFLGMPVCVPQPAWHVDPHPGI